MGGVYCKNKKCAGEPSFPYTPRKQDPPFRAICPKGHWNRYSFEEVFGQIATSKSLGPDTPQGVEEKFGQIATSKSLGPEGSQIATSETPVKKPEVTGESKATIDEQFLPPAGQNNERSYYLSEKEVNAFFKVNKITPLDLKIAGAWTGDKPKCLTEIAKLVGKPKQFVAYRTKKLVTTKVLVPIQGFSNLYEKSLKYLWWSIPALKAQIKSGKPIKEISSSIDQNETEQESLAVKPKIKKIPKRLTVEMHDPRFRLIPKTKKDREAYQKQKNKSVHWYFLNTINNEIRYIPDPMLGDFGKNVLHRKDYYIGVKNNGLDVWLYPNDNPFEEITIKDLKNKGEELKKILKTIYVGVEFDWGKSIEEVVKIQHQPSRVLKPDYAAGQVEVQVQPTSTPPVQVQSQQDFIKAFMEAQKQSQQDFIKDFVKVQEQIQEQAFIQALIKLGKPDGSDTDGIEGSSPLYNVMAIQYNKIGEIEQKTNNLRIMVHDEVKNVMMEIMPDLVKSMGEEMVKAFKQLAPEQTQSKIPAGQYT